MPDFLQNIFSSERFLPHSVCYLQDPALMGINFATDSLIGLSYVAISLALTYLVYRARRDIPFHRVFLAFGLFIISCGFTHFMEVWTLWNPSYWVAAQVKLLTAAASVATAVALPPYVPRTLGLVLSAKMSEERRHKLESANQELEALYAKIKELDELKTAFFANVSHELRTPLVLILGPAEQLLASKGLSEELRGEVELIRRNAQALLSHVNDLLDVAKLEAGRMQAEYADVDLAEMVRLTTAPFESLAHERQVDFAVEAPTSLPAQVDPEKLRRVIVNVLANAFKFAPAGGTVRCLLRAEGERAIVTIRDNGPGVKPEQRQAIFERFHQGDGGTPGRFGGTGLGLAIAREFVELHGGTIAVADAPGGGAEFNVELPLRAPADARMGSKSGEIGAAEELATQAVQELRPRAEAQTEPGAGTDAPLVLVVEDHPEMNRFMARVLGDRYRVATASNGEEGLHKALELRPDIILSDVMMPKMSGDQLVAEVRARPELDGIPIIVLTAKADEEMRVRLLREGAQDYLVKPFLVEELHARVRNLTEMKRARDVLQAELDSQSLDIAGLAAELSERRREAERLYEEAQRAIQVRDQFLTVASHELKTPLTVLQASAELLQRRAARDGAADERGQRAIAAILDQATRLNRLIESMLDFSRIQFGRLSLERAPVDLARLAGRVIAGMQPALKRHSIGLIGPDEPVVVEGDELRLEQVLQNLLLNAVKYSPEGGPIAVRLSRENGQVMLSVSDGGIGIPAADLPHLFTRFYRASNVDPQQTSGMGIGLYVVNEIVGLHHGTIEVSSREGEGSTFTVRLPVVSATGEAVGGAE